MTVKERRKQQYRQARDAGLDSKKSKQLSSLSEKNFKQKLSREKSNAKRRESYKNAREQGYTVEEAQNMRSTRRVKPEGQTLVIGYREYTHGDDPEAYYTMKQFNMPKSSRELRESIIEGHDEGWGLGYIGDHKIDIANNDHELELIKNMYYKTGYIPIYIGDGEHLKPLLSMLNIAMALLYPDKALEFVFDVIENLRLLKSPKAHKNADYLEKNIMAYLLDSEDSFI